MSLALHHLTLLLPLFSPSQLRLSSSNCTSVAHLSPSPSVPSAPARTTHSAATPTSYSFPAGLVRPATWSASESSSSWRGPCVRRKPPSFSLLLSSHAALLLFVQYFWTAFYQSGQFISTSEFFVEIVRVVTSFKQRQPSFSPPPDFSC